MSIVGGLIGGETMRIAATRNSVFGDWAMRNAWAVILLGSLAFWVTLGAVLVFG